MDALKQCAIQGMWRALLPDCRPARPWDFTLCAHPNTLVPARVQLFIEYLGAALRA